MGYLTSSLESFFGDAFLNDVWNRLITVLSNFLTVKVYAGDNENSQLFNL